MFFSLFSFSDALGSELIALLAMGCFFKCIPEVFISPHGPFFHIKLAHSLLLHKTHTLQLQEILMKSF